MSWLQIEIAANQQTAPQLENLLESLGAVSVTMTDAEDQPVYEPGPGETPLWHAIQVSGLFPGDRDRDSLIMELAATMLPEPLPPLKTQILQDQDWERAWIDSFRPMKFGERLWICPSWAAPPAKEAINLMLDPGLAFGTGTHPTTALCLEWLDCHPPQGQSLVDYGCGSGILGIAALLLGASQVVGVDTDPQALTATRDNCRKNHIADQDFPAYLPAGFTTAMNETGKVDGILANILAAPLTKLAADIAGLVNPGGWLLLSGILEHQAQEVSEAYAPWFTMDEPVFLEGWTRLNGVRVI